MAASMKKRLHRRQAQHLALRDGLIEETTILRLIDPSDFDLLPITPEDHPEAAPRFLLKFVAEFQ
jgi:hypothetical protein